MTRHVLGLGVGEEEEKGEEERRGERKGRKSPNSCDKF